MHSIHPHWVEAMATDDKEFFVALGLRLSLIHI